MLCVTCFTQTLFVLHSQVKVSPTNEHVVHIPSSALQKSRGDVSTDEVILVATVINSTYFKQTPPRIRGRGARPRQSVHMEGAVLGNLVLMVKAGNIPVENLSQPIQLTFINKQMEADFEHQTGQWNSEGCNTTRNGYDFICRCNHLSFFAVLVNPDLSVDETNTKNLNYITYIGSALSVLFAFISVFIYIGLHCQRPVKAIGLHMQLSGALFCLHLSFLFCSLWFWLPNTSGNSLVCKGLGLFLHWSLLATFTWIALEGFHLYLLLIKVFNIYIRKYLLKLSLVGWGLPTLVALVCGISGVYGKYDLEFKNDHNLTSTAQMCWMSSDFPHRRLVSYVTAGFLCLVILYNSYMLALVVFKLWGIRGGRLGYKSSSDQKKMKKEKEPELWKDCVTVLGLSCVLGLPWGLASTTYISLPGIYIFTIFNSLQGLFMFLWSVALSRKSRAENSSVREPSSQQILTTSFNN
ncbi:adhesion G protein-coupled receptor G3-like [Xenentodon cancila]